MIAPFARSRATIVESNGGTSMANATSLLAVVRMSFVSNGSLNAATTQYIGIAARSGLRPYCASSSAARSSASGCWRNSSHTAGAPGGSGPVDGCASNAPLQVTDRSPRMLSVSSAFSCPAFGMPTRMPDLRHDARVRDRRLHPSEVERLATVLFEVREDRRRLCRLRRERQRRSRAHVAGGRCERRAPSAVTRLVQTPL